MSHAESFIINIANADMHRLTARIMDVSNESQNKNVTIHERVCVIPRNCYLDWFEKSHPNVPTNIDEGTCCIQCMNRIYVEKLFR